MPSGSIFLQCHLQRIRLSVRDNIKMNTIILFAMLATAAATSVYNQVPEVPKAELELAKKAEVDETNELGEMEYDQDGVPKRTLPAVRQSLKIGVVGPDDRLVSRISHSVAAAQFIIHDQDVTFRGAPQTNITSIQIERVGNTMHAIPTIKSGGLGQGFVVINILGVRGSGFSYTISIYAAISCANS